jgi:hypothetical protein
MVKDSFVFFSGGQKGTGVHLLTLRNNSRLKPEADSVLTESGWMIGNRKVATKLLDDSKLKQDYCHCRRGKRVRRKALVELEPECSHEEHAVRERVCVSVLGIWFLSPVSIHGSTN